MPTAAGIFYDAPFRETSEGVKASMTGTASFRGGDLTTTHAADHSRSRWTRPSSAPSLRRTVPSSTGFGPYVVPRRPEYTDTELRSAYAYPGYPKPRAPYVDRTVQVFKNVAIGRPVVAHAGRSIGIPCYESLNDVHMHEYFERRFCNCNGIPSRPKSPRRSSTTTRTKARHSESDVTYRVAVTTGVFKNCGTSAKVYLRMKGTKGKTHKKLLSKKAKSSSGLKKGAPFVFEPGTTNYFKIRAPDIGNIESIIVEHDGLTKKAAWYLEQVTVTNVDTGKSWLFENHQWMSLHHGDCQISRELTAKPNQRTEYEIVVVTGDKPMAGTNANVFITIFGQLGQTPKMPLKGNSPNVFQLGQSDVFNLSAPSVGPMTKVRIEHDNTGPTPGWFLDRVVVTDKGHSKWKYYFPCSRWLAKDEDDGCVSRDLLGSTDPFAVTKPNKYKITVYTGDRPGAGTDANVYITMFGELGDSSELRLMNKTRNNFERGKADDFVLECPSLGRLQRIRISHDNTGASPGWFLKKVIIDDIDLAAVYEFPCEKWLAVDEGDGLTSRELLVGVGARESAGVLYEIHVTTGDVRNGGTDSRVYIVLYGGKKGEENSGKVWLEKGKFERARTDIFNISIAAMLSPLSRIDIGHDNSGPSAGWFLSKVVVICPRVGMEQHFHGNRWLALDEGDGRIECTLYEEMSLRKAREAKSTWNIIVYTSDLRGAGTDASVYLVAYGDKGKTDEMWLKNEANNFESGQVDEFKMELVDIGKPFKIRVGHDNSKPAAAWHLEKIEMENVSTRKRYLFNCDRWLARDEDDGEIVREIPAEGADIEKPLPLVKYNVQVQTGSKRGAGTDANVFVNIFGECGDTGERLLWKSQTSTNKFERGGLDVFIIEAVTLKKLTKIRIGHDGKNAGAGWFLEKVIVKQEGGEGQGTTFECNRWLDINEDDGAIVREITAGGSQMLATTTYNITVKTGDIRGAGTDANVHLKIFGEAGDTGQLALKSSENSTNKFERGRTDAFKVEAVDIGKITKIRFGHDGTGPGAGWFVDDLRIEVPSRGESYRFALHRWLARDEGDGLIELELQPTEFMEIEKSIPYEITVWTSDIRGAGTDAKVFIQMYGIDGKTEEYKLRNRTDNFEQGQVDKFKLEAADIGPIQKIRIGHDGSGAQSGWHLDKVLVQRYPSLKSKRLQASKRLQKLKDGDYSDGNDSDDAPAGRGRPSFTLGKSTENLRRGRNEEDRPSSRGAASPKQLRKKGSRSATGSGKVQKDTQQDHLEEYWFFCSRWFARDEDDKKIVREITATDSSGKPFEGGLKEVEYIITVRTGDVLGAGTDANVFITLSGDKGDTGERQLQDSNNRNKFEKGQEDIFKIHAVDLGKLAKLKIWHDNKGGGGAWFLDYVEVEDTSLKKSYFFPCQRWLATEEDDGQLMRTLVPVDKSLKAKLSRKDSFALRKEVALETKAALDTYHVFVTTGNKIGAGTDATVHIILFGEKDDTGEVVLKTSVNGNKNKFERNQTDEFIIESANIGDLRKIRIGHDNSGGGGAWFLDKVEIDCPSMGKKWIFPCNRWLAKDEDDGLLERELYPQDMDTEIYTPCIPYEITTYTSDVRGSDTSADVYIVLYGKDAATQQKSLCMNKSERKKCFKRGQSDKFVVELEDVGDTIEKIRIGHDGSGFGPGWHLDKVEIRRLNDTGKGSVTYTFPCGRWLARDEDDGAIERELTAAKIIEEVLKKDGQVAVKQKQIKEQLISKKYTVNVYTGDVSGAGTDANVFLTIFGERGDSGERKLLKSETYSNKFERNQVDRFTLEAVDLGKIFKIKIRHDNTNLSADWYLDRVEITDNLDGEMYLFHCERWLSLKKDDKKLEKTLYVKGYDGAMTSSTGTLKSMSRYGSSLSLDSTATIDIGKSPRVTKRQALIMDQVQEGPVIPYTVRVHTGNGEDNGTESHVWIRIIGPKKLQSEQIYLDLIGKRAFVPGSIETFSIEAADTKEVKQVEVGHDGVTPGSGWFLKQIELDVPTKGKTYVFACQQWLAKDKGDGRTARILSVQDGQSSITSYKPLVPYEITVVTGDVQSAGTDAVLKLIAFGDNGTSGEYVLEKAGERFERGRTDLFKIEIDDVAPLKKIRISHDGKSSRPDWFLEKIEMRSIATGDLYIFNCSKWLSENLGDKKLSYDLPATVKGKQVLKSTTYKISVKTSNVRGAGTDANVFVTLFGGNGDTGSIHLKDSATFNKPFENDQLDEFTIADMLSLGELTKCRVWHDNKGIGAAWHLEYIDVEDTKTKKKYHFECNKWLSKSDDDKQIVRELACNPVSSSEKVKGGKETVLYEITIATSDKKEAGMLHNAWLKLEGEKGTSKEFLIKNSAQEKFFRKGNKDTFTMESRLLGKLSRCILGAVERADKPLESKGGNSARWHCYEVCVVEPGGGCKYVFLCNQWIDITATMSKKSAAVLECSDVKEGKVASIRSSANVKYQVVVVTGNEKGGGTNANVFITIYGEHGDTGKRALTQKFRDLFERNQEDKFEIEALDLGELHKIKMEHDNAGWSPGWYLERVEVTNLSTSKKYVFPCQQWLDKTKGDKEIARELHVKD